MTKRLEPADRKAQILDGAIALATRQGLHQITRDGIADHVGVSAGLVSRYLGTMTELRRTVMRAAVKREIPEIVAAGLALGDKQAQRAPDALKRKALALLAKGSQ